MIRFVAAIALLLLPVSAAAQDVVFDIVATENCLDEAYETNANPAECIGKSAMACMEVTQGGYSTVAMGGCLDRERKYWDDRLNASFRLLRDSLKEMDADAKADGMNVPQQWPALLAMQRAWIPFRDSLCDFERSAWGGGTGGGPATLSCLMMETARQTLRIEDRLKLEY